MPRSPWYPSRSEDRWFVVTSTSTTACHHQCSSYRLVWLKLPSSSTTVSCWAKFPPLDQFHGKACSSITLADELKYGAFLLTSSSMLDYITLLPTFSSRYCSGYRWKWCTSGGEWVLFILRECWPVHSHHQLLIHMSCLLELVEECTHSWQPIWPVLSS